MPESDYRPIVTIDLALFTLTPDALCLVLHRRDQAPFEDRHVLIGGGIEPDRDTDAAAAADRILVQATGLGGIFTEQLMTFAGKSRDPRGWAVSIAYYALVPHQDLLQAASLERLAVHPVENLPELGFDHDRIAAAALARVRGKSAYTSLPAFLLPPVFTFPDLKSAYEKTLGQPLNDSAFRRKIGDLSLIEELPQAKSAATALRRRPAQLYRLRKPGLVEFDRTV